MNRAHLGCAVLGWSMMAVCGMGRNGLAQSATPPSQSDEPSKQELLDEVRALRAEVKDLHQRIDQQQPPATRPSGGASATPFTAGAAPDDLMHDIDRHQSLEISPLTAGWDPAKGFVIRSEDGNFLLHPWAFIQIREATNYRRGAKTGGGDSTDSGLELPRMKFIFDGNMFTPDFTYQFIWAVNTEGAAAPAGGTVFLQDAWGRYHFPGTPFAIRAGNIRDPFDHEQILFATRSLTPERSIVNNVMVNADNIVKGATIAYGFDTPYPGGRSSPVRVEAGYTGGMRNTGTNFQPFPVNPASWGAAGRVDFKFFGRWTDYTQFTSIDDKEPLLVAGAGVDYTEAGSTRQFSHVGDVQFDTPNGLALYAAYLGRYTTNNSGPPGTNGAQTTHGVYPDTYDSTLRFQLAYLLGHNFEPFARYEYLHFSNIELPKGSARDTIQDITVGFNYYFVGHRSKISCAASYLPDGSPIANTQSDLLTNRRNEVIVQLQYQLMI